MTSGHVFSGFLNVSGTFMHRMVPLAAPIWTLTRWGHLGRIHGPLATSLLLATFGLLNVLMTNPAACAEPKDRPNIVLIMADDMGYECIAANGSLDYKTPNLDQLAAEGMRFSHCYAQPLCTPTRAKLMTGISNKRNYVKFGTLDRSQTTFGNILKDAGYKTCIAGKWQLGKESDSPQHFGFEQSLLWQHTKPRTDKEGRDTRYPNPHLQQNGKPLVFEDGEYSSDLFVDYIGKFMEENREEPFFVYYPMALVHCPFCPTPDSADWDPESQGSDTYKGSPKYFADMVAYTDKSVGKLVAKLDELGLRENTLLIFIGDNGTDTPIVTNTTYGKVSGAKGSMIDCGTRVPCIVSWPTTITKPKVVEDIIDASDFLHTICEATQVLVPSHLPIDGQSFLPQLQGKEGKPRESIYIWYSRNGNPKDAKAFARNQQYKLYERGDFYAVANDPLEQKPLADAELNADQKAAKAILQAKLDSMAKVVPPNARQK